MTEAQRAKAYKKFLNVSDYNAQMMMCIEEMSELTKEFCKYQRKNQQSDEVREHIIEEIADVLNTAEQMEMYFGKDEVQKVRDAKIERALERLIDETPKK